MVKLKFLVAVAVLSAALQSALMTLARPASGEHHDENNSKL